jgi:hypothetical protein
LSEVRLHRSRAEPSGESVGSWTDAKGGTVSRCFGSKASPGTNAIGYVPCVVLKSLCPMSANSWRKSDVTTCSSGYPSATSLRASFPTIMKM